MICVLWVINFAFAYDFLLHFGTIPAVWYLFYFHILLHHCTLILHFRYVENENVLIECYQ
jgi:hypothetical protein